MVMETLPNRFSIAPIGSAEMRAAAIHCCPSQHPVGHRKLAEHEGHQEAEREHDEHHDDEFEQGIETWAMVISSGYVRKLVRAFQLSIQPFHPDQCGGLKLLGNFYFGLGSPLLIVSGLLIGLILFSLLEYASGIDTTRDSVLLVTNVGFSLLLLLLFVLPVIVLVFIFPLRDIHRNMVSEGKTNETSYFIRTEALRQEIQALLAAKQVVAAKAVQEEKALVETLYAPYPTGPFHVRSKISKTVFEVSVSLLIGLITAAFVQYFFPAILTLLFQTQ